LQAGFGEQATDGNEYCFDYRPRLTGDHSSYASTLGMLDGAVKGFLVVGENPAVGSANSKLHRLAMANLDWLLVRDLVLTESATLWNTSPDTEPRDRDPA